MNVGTIINTSYLFLMKQEQASKLPSGQNFCRYRYEKLACGVGCFVDDETANRWDAGGDCGVGTSIESIIRSGFVPEKYEWMLEHSTLLTKIQSLHDENESNPGEAFRDQLTRDFTRLAIRYGVTLQPYLATA